jgi:lipoprotein-releasing system permease protein
MLGVTFGIAMFILMISFMTGVNLWVQDTMLSATPHVRLYNDLHTDFSSSVTGRFYSRDRQMWVVVDHPKPKQIQDNLKDAPGILADIERQPGVAVVSPLVSTQLLFNYGPVQLSVATDGVDIRKEDRLFDLSGKMKSGRPEDLLTIGKGILIGYRLARKLNAGIGDMVTAIASSGAQMRFRIVGIYQFGLAPIDEGKAYITLASMQELLGRNRDYITDIRVRLKNLNEARALSAAWEKKYGYKADNWETVNASIEAGNRIRNTLTYVVSFTMMLVAGVGIYNIMNMVIMGKIKDIAILKAQGFDRKDIVRIFLTQSLVIGVAGGAAGLLLGFLSSYALSRVPFPQDDYMDIRFYPVSFQTGHYLLGAAFGLLTTLAAGWTPAAKAGRLDPVSILRN